MEIRDIIAMVAEKHGVSEEEVYADMKEAIAAGFHSTDPEVKEIWKNIPMEGSEPTPEEVIHGITMMIQSGWHYTH